MSIKASSFSIFTDKDYLVIAINIPNTLDLINLTYNINSSDLFNELKNIIIEKLGVEYGKK